MTNWMDYALRRTQPEQLFCLGEEEFAVQTIKEQELQKPASDYMEIFGGICHNCEAKHKLQVGQFLDSRENLRTSAVAC
jgi:hypothetical protein